MKARQKITQASSEIRAADEVDALRAVNQRFTMLTK